MAKTLHKKKKLQTCRQRTARMKKYVPVAIFDPTVSASIPFVPSTEGRGFFGVPKTNFFLDNVRGRIGIPLRSPLAGEQMSAAAQLIRAATAITADGTTEEHDQARVLWLDAALQLEYLIEHPTQYGTEIVGFLSTLDKALLLTKANYGYETVTETTDNLSFDVNSFNARHFRLMQHTDTFPTFSDNCIVPGTYGQVEIVQNILWVNVYWCANPHGFRPDTMVALAARMFSGGMHATDCIKLQLFAGILRADQYACKMDEYRDSPAELALNPSAIIIRLLKIQPNGAQNRFHTTWGGFYDSDEPVDVVNSVPQAKGSPVSDLPPTIWSMLD